MSTSFYRQTSAHRAQMTHTLLVDIPFIEMTIVDPMKEHATELLCTSRIILFKNPIQNEL